MGRVYFPTKNELGVRTLSGEQLAGADYADFRGPAEPAPRGASIPVNLGAIMIANGAEPAARSNLLYRGVFTADGPVLPGPAQTYIPPAAPLLPASPTPSLPPGLPITALPAVLAQPVSQQTTPTPQVTVPATPSTGAVLITSGGGTAAPAVAPAAAPSASPDITGQVAAWLSGSTTLFSYAVPNALLAAAVVLGFAWLSSGPSGRKR